MSQRLTESFVNTNLPGSYIDPKVKSTPVGVSSSGNIVIIGEASGGAVCKGIDSVNGDILKDNYFTPTQADRVIRKYISGPIVDAFMALASPSSDANISGSANKIYIAKTNQGEQASALMDASYGTLTDKNYGIDGNKYYYNVTQTKSEVAPSITSDAITFNATEEEGSISVDQAGMADGDYFYIAAQDGTKYAVALDTTGGALVVPTGAHYVAATHKVVLDVSSIGTDADLATAIIGAFNGLTSFTAKVTLVDNTSAVIGINQIVAGVVAELPNAYDDNDSVSGASVGACAVAYVASQTGDSADGSIFNGLSFSVRVNGGAITVVTLSSVESAHDTVAELASEIDALLPSGISCVASGNQLVFALDTLTDDQANVLGYGRSFELIDSSLGDLAAIELAAGLVVSSQEPEIQLDINRKDNNTNEQYLVAAEIAMKIGYAGTTATCTINSTNLTTTVVGGAGANLNIILSQFNTIKDLADFINSQTDYTASVVESSTQKSPSALDQVSAVGICGDEAGRIKRALYNFESKVGESSVLDFVAIAVKGLPLKKSSVSYLEDGEKGATSASNIVSAIADLEGIKANFVIPLFSRDASDDIADGLTDSASTYSIDAINALVKSHVLKMSTPKIKKYRQAFLSFWGSYADAKAKSSSLAHYRAAVCMQKTSQVNSFGTVVSYLPWHTACIAAGMQAGGFYKAIVNKFANVISFEDPTGFDSGNPSDLEDALDAGLLVLEKAVVGNKFVSDQTTYGVDTNFVYNSIQAVYAADLVSLDLVESFGAAFVGQSLADVDAATGLSFLAYKMDSYKKQKLIAASSDAPLGFKNAKVESVGPILRVSVEIKLATAIYFIPINLDISQISSSAEA
ncbi:MAG TPA: hypothetical protein VI911_11995 [Patescibacteria group bacterium]|nr:hypothetical protein [Patescibacteria group bacterium]